MTAESLWGIDLGGTKIECAVLESTKVPRILFRHRIATEGHLGYRHVLGRIESLIETATQETGLKPRQIGIGTPGSIDPETGLLRGCNSQHLQHQPFRFDLEKRLGIPVVVENDANCFALAETRMGVVQTVCPEARVVFGIIMGTGVGGGLVVNEQLVSGANRIAGEWGHNFLDASGGECYCGRIGCVETVISGPALERFYATQSGRQKTLAEIDVSTDTDPHAADTMARLIEFFARGVSGLINIVDPDVIVIGGGVGNIDRLYTDGAERITPEIFSPSMHTRIVKPTLGDSAGVFGAAYLQSDGSTARG